MSKGQTLCMHDMFNNIMVEYQIDLSSTNREEQEQNIERRLWVVVLLKFLNNAHSAISNNRNWHNLFCCMQMMVTVFASLSITWSAVANLAYFGLTGLVYKFCVAAIMTMSCYTCLLAAIQYIKFGLDGNRLMLYQKMRGIEIKLFRSPDIPHSNTRKTQALIEYMNYYSVEKSVFKMIKEVWTNNTRIDHQILHADWIPIELKTRMALVMRAQRSTAAETNQRRICRFIRDEFSRVYNTIMRESTTKRFDKHHYITKLYDLAADDSITNGAMERICPEKKCDPDRWIAKVIVAYTVARFAYFARKHGDEQSKMLIKEANGPWIKLSAQKIAIQKMKAFRWSIKQHLKRQNKTVSSVNVGHFFMHILKTCFIICAALIPAGFGLLASSPVAAIIGWLGSGWSCHLCTWFWFSGVVDYMNTSRKDAEKIWTKICEFVNKNFIQRESRNPLIEQHTWNFSLDICFRAFVAFSMASARSLFTYNSISKIVKNPASIGGEKLFYRLFKLVLPWLEPIFLPLCACLSFVDGVLHYAQITKYYSAKHLPRPTRGDIRDSESGGYWGNTRQQIRYLWCHNFDFSKRAVPKLLKLVGTVIALLQSMVLYVSAQHVLGSTLALCLMPGVALVIIALNRRSIEAGTDLWHQFMHSDFFDISLQNKYRSWFRMKRDSRIRDPIHRSSNKNSQQTNQSINRQAVTPREKVQPVRIITDEQMTQVARSTESVIRNDETQIGQTDDTAATVAINDCEQKRASPPEAVNRFGRKKLHVSIGSEIYEGIAPQSSSDDVEIDDRGIINPESQLAAREPINRERSLTIMDSENDDKNKDLAEKSTHGSEGVRPPAFFTPKREFGQRDTIQTPGTDRESMASMSPRSAPGTPLYNEFRKVFINIQGAITPDDFKQLENVVNNEPDTAAQIIYDINNRPRHDNHNGPREATESETDANRRSPRSINHSTTSLDEQHDFKQLENVVDNVPQGYSEDPATDDDDEEINKSLLDYQIGEDPMTDPMEHTDDDRPKSWQSDERNSGSRSSSRLSRPSSSASNGNRPRSRTTSIASPIPTLFPEFNGEFKVSGPKQ